MTVGLLHSTGHSGLTGRPDPLQALPRWSGEGSGQSFGPDGNPAPYPSAPALVFGSVQTATLRVEFDLVLKLEMVIQQNIQH